MPAHDGGQRVGSSDEVELRFWEEFAQVAQRIDGIGGPLAVNIHARDGKARVGGRGHHRHQVAVLGRSDVAVGLLPRLAGGNKDDGIEGKAVGGLAGRYQVAIVDGIKGATHDADALWASHGW